MGKPVSFANCSLMCLVGFGVDEKADFRISSCFAFMVVRGPRRFEPAPPSPLPPPAPPSGLLFSVWLSLVSGSPSREPSTDRSRTLPHHNRTTTITITTATTTTVAVIAATQPPPPPPPPAPAAYFARPNRRRTSVGEISRCEKAVSPQWRISGVWGW